MSQYLNFTGNLREIDLERTRWLNMVSARLSARDNRLLRFEEVMERLNQVIFYLPRRASTKLKSATKLSSK